MHAMTLTTASMAALLLVLCFYGSAEGSFSPASPTLNAIWSKAGILVTQVYPTTGTASPQSLGEVFTGQLLFSPQRCGRRRPVHVG